MTEAQVPNEAQIEHWNDRAGFNWVKYQDYIDSQIGPYGQALLERLEPRAGEAGLDIGCGCGTTTSDLAQAVGAGGRILGVDISAPMIARAKQVAHDRGLSNAEFLLADASQFPFEEGTFDFVHSRFGMMFFDDPPAALANIRTALKPGGRLGLVCWQGIEKNPWISVPLGVIGGYIDLPPMPDPHAPGPVAFADPHRVETILTSAGYSEVAFEGCELPARLASSGIDEAVDMMTRIGPAAGAFVDIDNELAKQIRKALAKEMAKYLDGDAVYMDSGCWIFSAVNNG